MRSCHSAAARTPSRSSPDGRTLYVAEWRPATASRWSSWARNRPRPNAAPSTKQVVGLIPTGWYPGAIRLSAGGKRLFVANVKGHGALQPRRLAESEEGPQGQGRRRPDPAAIQKRGKNSHDHLGSVSLIDSARCRRTEEIHRNRECEQSARLLVGGPGQASAGCQAGAGPRTARRAVGLRARHLRHQGEPHLRPGLRRHEGRQTATRTCASSARKSRPISTSWPASSSLLDNFYCSGVLSADGHSWTNAAYVTDYLEKQFGQFIRSYPYEGSDPLAFPTTGFLWDNALAAQEDVPQLRRVREEQLPAAEREVGRLVRRLHERHREGEDHGHAEPALAGQVQPSELSRLPVDDAGCLSREAVPRRTQGVRAQGDFPNLVYLFLPVRPHQWHAARHRRRRGRWSPTTTWPWAWSSRRSPRASSGRRRASS